MTGKPAFRRFVLAALLLFAAAAGGGFLFTAHIPFSAKQLEEWKTSPCLTDRAGEVFSVFLSEDSEWSLPVPLAGMGKWIPLVALEVEDRRFRQHPGVDPRALLRAFFGNLRAGRVVSGASTITSQLVRLSHPRPRTFRTKLYEFAEALRAERVLSKDRILELYLNRAPFGGNIRGVEAASRMYFSKGARELSLAEAALLVGMLRGPTVYRPDRNPGRALERRNSILDGLEERGVISKEILRLAKAEKLPSGRGAFPSRAWHFALAALGERKEGGEVKTTLSLPLQELLERTLASSLASLPREITAAGVILANSTGEVLAYCGNGRLGSEAAGSWVDCGRSLRSPGSALKPFAYLAAFDRGLYTPASLLADTPLAFSGQSPRNFDLTYRGPVAARTALADSLNVPAVRVLRAVGNESVLDLLRNVGFFSLDKSTGHYGDSLILGGCEVTLLQMAGAYTVLSTLGTLRTPTFLPGEILPPRRVVSVGSAFMVADILKDPGRLLPLHARRVEGRGHWFAFKTGTSYGYRDAWTAAYTPSFTLVIWFGDPSGESHPELVGLHASAPAMVEILRTVSKGEWYDPPAGVAVRRVCSLSGQPPSHACPSVRDDYYLPGISSSQPCALHRFTKEGTSVVWPSELEDYALRRALAVERPPEISIISPLPGSVYFLTPLGKDQKVALKAEGARLPVYWFVGGEFAGKQESRLPLFWPLAGGSHRVSLVDGDGRTASSEVTVRTIEKGPEGSPSGPDGSLSLMPLD